MLYYSPFLYVDGASAFMHFAKPEFSVVTDESELQDYGSLHPGEYEECK